MKVSIIVAASNNNVIGKNNTIPWKLSDDMKFFKRTTMGFPVLMGRKTFESIGKPLPGRLNIVVSRNKDFKVPEGVLLFDNVTEAINRLEEEPVDIGFIIGGEIVYKNCEPIVDQIYLTRVDCEIEGGDAFFPTLNTIDLKLVSTENHLADEKNEYNYSFLKYERN